MMKGKKWDLTAIPAGRVQWQVHCQNPSLRRLRAVPGRRIKVAARHPGLLDLTDAFRNQSPFL
jgi:hypothetical protein